MCVGNLIVCPDLFSNVYHFSAGISGLCYIGLGLGFLLATIFGASFADKVYHTVSSYDALEMNY